LGDRSTGKTSIFLYTVLSSYYFNYIASVDGFGTKKLFNIYIGISLNLSKLSKFIASIIYNYYLLIIATHSSSPALLNFLIPFVGITICERLRDRGYDSIICFDDLSKHSKSYRQISLILGKIPSRDAFPADIFNIHSSLLERCGKLSLNLGKLSGSITAFPIVETINSDITDFIATNIISITDGQFYLSRSLFINSVRPAIDSGLSVSRIGSAAQCKLMKVVSAGLKNELTNLRLSDLVAGSFEYLNLTSLNNIFYQHHLSVSSLSFTILLLLIYRNSLIMFNSFKSIVKLYLLLAFDFYYLSYIISSSYHNYSSYLYAFLLSYTNSLCMSYHSYSFISMGISLILGAQSHFIHTFNSNLSFFAHISSTTSFSSFTSFLYSYHSYSFILLSNQSNHNYSSYSMDIQFLFHNTFPEYSFLLSYTNSLCFSYHSYSFINASCLSFIIHYNNFISIIPATILKLYLFNHSFNYDFIYKLFCFTSFLYSYHSYCFISVNSILLVIIASCTHFICLLQFFCSIIQLSFIIIWTSILVNNFSILLSLALTIFIYYDPCSLFLLFLFIVHYYDHF
jgi:hypothetical protein